MIINAFTLSGGLEFMGASFHSGIFPSLRSEPAGGSPVLFIMQRTAPCIAACGLHFKNVSSPAPDRNGRLGEESGKSNRSADERFNIPNIRPPVVVTALVKLLGEPLSCHGGGV